MMFLDMLKDTIFLKKDSSLQKQYDALNRLLKEQPNNNQIKEDLFLIKKGLDGENEIEYQLMKSNLGMFVMRDINIEHGDLKAQIDYVIITRAYCYFVECKNLVGNITVNSNGDFIREYSFNNRKIRKGMYSPLRQVEAQRDVYKKIWNSMLGNNKVTNYILRRLAENNYTNIHRVLVVCANQDTILNNRYAPKDIKSQVIRADSLIRKIKTDLENSDKDIWCSRKEMEKWASSFLRINVEKNIDYYEYYKNKFVVNSNENEIVTNNSSEDLKNRLITFRKARSTEMGIPAYYVFNNKELELLLEYQPKTMNDLIISKILSPIKVKTHGELIISIISQYN